MARYRLTITGEVEYGPEDENILTVLDRSREEQAALAAEEEEGQVALTAPPSKPSYPGWRERWSLVLQEMEEEATARSWSLTRIPFEQE